ncbi:MAG: hypothetical protein LBT80_03865 [Lactobacillaceae bacterium]|jgi:hypothetical protein|nr:hypothetical protein [Lactobacillaceae bacterium]
MRIGLTSGYDVILVDAATAHASGAAGAINVGFETTPDFKYSGVYSQPVAFKVGVINTTPVPIT